MPGHWLNSNSSLHTNAGRLDEERCSTGPCGLGSLRMSAHGARRLACSATQRLMAPGKCMHATVTSYCHATMYNGQLASPTLGPLQISCAVPGQCRSTSARHQLHAVGPQPSGFCAIEGGTYMCTAQSEHHAAPLIRWQWLEVCKMLGLCKLRLLQGGSRHTHLELGTAISWRQRIMPQAADFASGRLPPGKCIQLHMYSNTCAMIRPSYSTRHASRWPPVASRIAAVLQHFPARTAAFICASA